MNYFCWTVNKQISYPHPLMLIFLGTYRGELPRHLLCPHNLMLIFGSSLIINPIFAFTHSISGSALRLALRSITREEIHIVRDIKQDPFFFFFPKNPTEQNSW